MTEELVEAIKESDEQESQQNLSQDEETQEEYEQLPTARMSPTTMVIGEVVDIFYTGDITDEQPSGDFGVTIQNPTIPDGYGDIFENHLRADSPTGLARDNPESNREKEFKTDYKVANESDQGTRFFSEGVSAPRSDVMPSEQVDAFKEDKITFYFSGVAGRKIIEALDVNGVPSAYETRDGENSQGLVEYHPDWESGEYQEDVPYPRMARYPQLREDVEDSEIGIVITRRSLVDEDYDGDMYRSFVFRNEFEGDSLEEIKNHKVEPTEGEAEYDSHLKWKIGSELSDDEGDADISALDTDSDGSGDSQDSQDGDSGMWTDEQESTLDSLASSLNQQGVEMSELSFEKQKELVTSNLGDDVDVEGAIAEVESRQ